MRSIRWRRWALGAALVVLVAAFLVSFALDEPLRRRLEAQLNANLVGYDAVVRGVRFHPFGFAITLRDVRIAQEKHPDPPVAEFPRLHASVHWRALLSLRLVADFRFDAPRIHVDRTHLEAEAEDEVAVEDRGWQDALQSIYPLEINQLVIRDGAITYLEDRKAEPLHVDRLEFRATNIRNIRSPDRTYPSEVHLTGRIFDAGSIEVDGHADFLATPHAGVKGSLALADVPLGRFAPVLERYNLTIADGTLSLAGDVELSPNVKTADVREIALQNLDAAYLNRPARAAAAAELREKTAEAAGEVANDPGILLVVRQLEAKQARIRYVDEAADPDYTLVLDQARLVAKNISNHAKRPPTTGELTGRFMGSGATTARFTFRPETNGPDFDLALEIEGADLVAMNDLFRAHADFDVTAGRFSLYTELDVHDRRVEGYVKPFFADMKVYDPRQDADEGVLQQAYERVVGGVARLLENPPRDSVATKTSISGPLENPRLNTVETVLRLIQNAFFRAILPGFEEEARANA